MLKLAEFLYASGVRLRELLYQTSLLKPVRLAAPVISVGNLTVGGSGKTPFVEYIGKHLLRSGAQGVILSRGYGGSAEHGNLVVSNGRELLANVGQSGDEPMLLARNLPGIAVVVGKKRHVSARLVEGWYEKPIFLLDDGFQHRQLARDINIVLVDATRRLQDMRMLPAGQLREPVARLERADAVVLVRAHLCADIDTSRQEAQRYCEAPVFAFRHTLVRPYRLSDQMPAEISGPVVAMAGIARPELFAQDLELLGLEVAAIESFADHHPFVRDEVDSVVAKADSLEAGWIVTTEKDAVRLLEIEGLNRSRLAAFPLRMEPVGGDGFDEWFDKRLEKLLEARN